MLTALTVCVVFHTAFQPIESCCYIVAYCVFIEGKRNTSQYLCVHVCVCVYVSAMERSIWQTWHKASGKLKLLEKLVSGVICQNDEFHWSAILICSWHLYVWAEATDNASVNFVKYKGDYYVSTETNYMRRVDPQSLETKEKVSQSIEKSLLSADKQSGEDDVTVNNEDNKDDDAVHLRWTGVNTSLSTQLQLTHTMTVREPRTTWATPMEKEVTFLHSLLSTCLPKLTLYISITHPTLP